MDGLPLYQRFARLIDALHKLRVSGKENGEWWEQHISTIESLVHHYFPSGSGFDGDSTLDISTSMKGWTEGKEQLVIYTEFHHMSEGMYTHWSGITIYVTPSLMFDVDYTIIVDDPPEDDPEGFEDYVIDVFNEILTKQERVD